MFPTVNVDLKIDTDIVVNLKPLTVNILPSTFTREHLYIYKK